MSRRPLPWSEAIDSALYGPGGFFHRSEGPAGHFRTSVHASPLFAEAIFTLLVRVDAALGHPDPVDLVDVGAGRGELFAQLAPLLETATNGLGQRIRLHAVERAERPPLIQANVRWAPDLPEDIVGLVVANEYLDNIALDVVEVGPDGLRRVLVSPLTGEESPGGPIGLRDAGWLDQWWPLTVEGARAEIGTSRDQAWGRIVGSLAQGVAVGIDYGHVIDERGRGEYEQGTLTGYRAGRVTAPIPDGSCDLTAHVSMDSCAAAGRRAGADTTDLVRQREALLRLGISGALPPVDLATANPSSYASALSGASQAAELLDPGGLGSFWWLTQTVGCALLATE